jgi:ubiquinone/menaquinone biosynthesis C-methylase UbiE
MNPHSYSVIAKEVFAPLYPYYAGLIVEKTGIRTGVCLDAGCGGGDLGLAVAEISNLDLCLMDKSAEMLGVAAANIRTRNMSVRARTLEADVQAIPLPNESIDLVVSRGSVPFWKDLPTAFGEVWRLLKPGGHAYIGGGLGTAEMRTSIQRKMRERNPDWHSEMKVSIPHRTVDEYYDALLSAGIRSFEVERGDDGTWIQFQKR